MRKAFFPLDVVGIGAPLIAAAVAFLVAVLVDPLIAVAGVLLLAPYLAAYATARIVAVPRALIAAAATIMTLVGAVMFIPDRNATTLIYVVAPGSGLLVSSLIATLSHENAD